MSNIIKTLSTTLKGSLSTTGLTMTVQKFVDSKGIEVVDADFNGNFVVVLEQGTNIEIILCTGITQNASDDTAILTIDPAGRDLNPKSPWTGGATGSQLFTTGASVITTNDPHTMSRLGNIDKAQVWALLQTFTLAPVSSADAVGSTELVRKSQLDNAVLGTLTSSPIVFPATGGETLAVDQLVYFKSSDSRWWLADADIVSTVENVILGITRGTATAGTAVTNGVTILGEHTASTAIFVADTAYYASNTAGGFSSTVGTKEVSLGQATSTTKFIFSPRYNQQITEDIQDALVGTSGTPSSTNKYVTNVDTTVMATQTAITIAFVDSNPDTITDSGSGFLTAGFKSGDSITVSGSTSNNSTFTIATVIAGTITLVSGDNLTAETAGASVTITASTASKVVRLKSDSKLPAVDGSNLLGIAPNVFGGDGSDGDVIIASGTTTLVRDMFYNNLTIDSGATINTNQYKVYVLNVFTNNGTVKTTTSAVGGIGGTGVSNGAGGTGGSGAGALTSGTLKSAGGGTGGAGGAFRSGVGIAGIKGDFSLAVGIDSDASGAGGVGGSGTTIAGGAGGASTTSVAVPPIYNNIKSLQNMQLWVELSPSSNPTLLIGNVGGSGGGGGGSGNDDNVTGGGGGGGG